MRRSPAENLRIAATAVAVAILVATLAGIRAHTGEVTVGKVAATEINRSLVAALALTDLALWSEAAYCRHPTQTDGFAAWNDHPGAPEHFPAGSLVPPPSIPFVGGVRHRALP